MSMQPISLAEPERIWSLLYSRTGTVAYVGSKQRVMALREIKGPELVWTQLATPDHIKCYEEKQRAARLAEIHRKTAAHISLHPDGPSVA